MKVVVIGDGKVGKTLIEHISKEGHVVVVIDKKPEVIEELVNKHDVMGICGNGASYLIQKNAGVSNADLVIAATSSDETNLLACFVAKKLGAKSTIARVRGYEYNNQTKIMMRDFGMSMIINPEKETADEIKKILDFPELMRIDSFAKGAVDLVELYVPEKSSLVGQSLITLGQKYPFKVLICAVQRNDEVIIPTGSFTFQPKDKIHLTGTRKNIQTFLSKLQFSEDKIKNVLIIGGGKITTYLGKELLKDKYNVKIIEKDHKRCLELSELLPDASIICGDGADQTILEDEGLAGYDAVICLTGTDEENIIISMYSNKQKIKKIVTKVNKSSFAALMESISTASIVSPKDIISSKILSYVRAKNNSHGSNVVTLYKLVNNKVEAVEFNAKPKSRILNTPLRYLKLKPNMLISAILRDGEAIIPSGNDTILENDNVIVVTTNQFLSDLDSILE